MGSDAEYWRNHCGFGPEYETRWLTISYLGDTRYKTLHIVAEKEEVSLFFSQVISQALTIRALVLTLFSHQLLPTGNTSVPSYRNLADVHVSYEERQLLWERYHWKSSDFSGKRDFAAIERMAYRFGLGITTLKLRDKFDDVDPTRTDHLNFRQFQEFWRKRGRRSDVRDLLSKLQMGNEFGEIDFKEFHDFLVDVQKVNLD
jgi:hypothetical protein